MTAACLACALLLVAETPPGEALRLPVTRDLWLSSVASEADANLGGAARLKFKSYQELSLLDIDPTALKGRRILAATLHLRQDGKERLHRVSVGSVGAEWVEGTSGRYAAQAGSSSFNRRRHPDDLWAGPGSDLCSVIHGQGGTLWRMADAFPPDARGWQKVAVDPLVVAARVAGISHGFVVFDDTGSEWTRDGERLTFHPFPNRFFHSRESGPASAPYLNVWLGERDDQPPAAPAELHGEAAELPAGEVLLSWRTPADVGGAGTIGFRVEVEGKPVPRYLIPVAGKAGDRVTMHLRDPGLAGGARVRVGITAVDAAGNAGAPLSGTVTVSDRGVPTLPGKVPQRVAKAAPLPRLGDAEVAVLDELDKVHPVRGELIPPQPEGYPGANHLWDAASRTIRLHAARNEIVAFQVLLRGAVQDVRPTLRFTGEVAPRVRIGRYHHVKTGHGPLPDAIVPLAGGLDVPTAAEGIDGQKSASLHVELIVPHQAVAGSHKATLQLRAGDASLDLPIELTVWDFTLPDRLSFLPEMNGYGLPADERGYYRVGHLHRTVVNIVPYSQRGEVTPGWGPTLNGRTLDWTAFDRRFGPYLDGSAFADLPRAGVPLECFYLPVHENWPAPMEGNYNGDYWADRAFPPTYRAATVEAARAISAHVDARKWTHTRFQFFLNNKNNFKARGWSRGSSPWLLDEPAHFQDFWALRYYGQAIHEGIAQASPAARLLYRADISRPMWQRDSLDGLLDYNVVSSAMRPYHRLVSDRQRRTGELMLEYGGSNAVEASNLQPAAWCVDAWAMGCDGVVPWLTIGTAGAWATGEETCLLYPPRRGEKEPTPSIRLKSYLRGQQDVEYLTLWSQLKGEPRWAAGAAVRRDLRLSGRREGTGFVGGEDAGRVSYAGLRPADLWQLRLRLGQALSAARPAPRKQLVPLTTPRRDPSRLAPGLVRGGEQPEPPRSIPRPETTDGVTRTLVLRDSEAVRDVLLDAEKPRTALGRAGRENAVKKRGTTDAFLVRFDLDRLKLPAGARVKRATLSLFVWDPSSQARTKVCAFPLKTAWDEATATYAAPARDRTWKNGAFDPGHDAGAASPATIVPPDAGDDTVDPPLEVRLDVTEFVRAWLAGKQPNHGVAIAPVPDRAVDDGHHTRFQLYAREHAGGRHAPRLTVEFTDRP